MQRMLRVAAIACTMLFLVAMPASADPPGNNGTVKIDGVEFDNHPDNEPHVGCIFQVDWYGFDEGDFWSHVTFEIWPPVGPMETILEDDVFIGEDSNAGGGSEAGHDASATYDLSSLLAQYEPHPNQGWHVKLTTNNEFSQGSDVKHKTFWVTGCYPLQDVSGELTSGTGQVGFGDEGGFGLPQMLVAAIAALGIGILVSRRAVDRAAAKRAG